MPSDELGHPLLLVVIKPSVRCRDDLWRLRKRRSDSGEDVVIESEDVSDASEHRRSDEEAVLCKDAMGGPWVDAERFGERLFGEPRLFEGVGDNGAEGDVGCGFLRNGLVSVFLHIVLGEADSA